MKKLLWKQLGRCRTAESIAALLKRHKIKGYRDSAYSCPLANATGHEVDELNAYNFCTMDVTHVLTKPEKEFVRRFDSGCYSYLDAEED